MNAQLRELLREARCPSAAYGKHPDQCVWCEARAAALAAPKEAGAEPLIESPYFPDVESVVRYMDDLANAVNAITGDEGEDDPLTVLQRYAANPPVDQRQEGAVQKCGCGKPGEYQQDNGWSCNKYMRCASPPTEAAAAVGEVDRLREALSSIYQYGSDTLSGRMDGPDDRKWQRDAVVEMTRRAREGSK